MKSGIILLICICSFQLIAQGIFHEQFGYESGIPSERIYDLFKDSKGNIWCTSDEGLIRYNGIKFKIYPAPGNISRSGSFIQEDRFGRIWYQTFDGAILYLENETLRLLPYFKNSGFKPYIIHHDFLYHVSDRGIERVNLKNQQRELFIAQSRVGFCHLIDNYLYFGNKQINRIHLPSNRKEKVYQIGSQINSLVTFKGDNELIVTDKSTSNPIFIRIGLKGNIQEDKLSLSETIQNLYVREKQFWFFTQNGIIIKNQQLQNVRTSKLLEGKNVSSLAKDKNGYLWVGSPSNGIYLVKSLKSREFLLTNDKFSSISVRNGVIYTGTTAGKIYRHNLDLEGQLFFDSGENNQILAMDFHTLADWDFFTGNGSYFVSHQSGKTLRIHPSIKEIARINDQEVGVAATGISGRIKLIELLNEQFGKVGMVEDLRAKSCAYDPQTDLLYVASNHGLISIGHSGKESIIKRSNSPLFVKKLIYANNRIMGITFEGKLFEIKNKKIIFTHQDVCFQNIKSCGNTCYLQTKDGIYSYKNQTIEKLNSFRNTNHIIDFEVLGKKLFVITSDKLILTNLFEDEHGLERPRMNVSFVLFNQKAITDWKNIPYDHNEIRIGIDVINFDFLNDYNFIYSINDQAFDFDPENEEIRFPALEPGMYSINFLIKDKQSGLIVFKKQLTPIIINPPIWKQLWFILSSALIITLFMIAYYRRKMKQIERKNRAKLHQLMLENSVKESRLQLIKSQMNPHFFFNAINNIQSYIFTNDTKEASLYLSKFSRLTRKILEFSDVNTITLSEEIEALTLYLDLQKMRFQDLNYEIHAEQIHETDKIVIPTMMFQPYVENAILHGLSHSMRQKHLSIRFTLDDQHLITRIKDNGVGRLQSEKINAMNPNKNRSFATKANLERIQLLNQHQYRIQISYVDLVDTKGFAEGTEVTVRIEL